MTTNAKRQSGILLHVTSLPGREGIGTLSDGLAFLDPLVEAGQSIWQILPFGPTSLGDSPFQGPSVFAGNPNLIGLEDLVEKGDLSEAEFESYLDRWKRFKEGHAGRSDEYVEYGFLWEEKLGFEKWGDGETSPLIQGYRGFSSGRDPDRIARFETFCAEERDWLEDYALFMTLKTVNGFSIPWNEWDRTYRLREPGFERSLPEDLVGFYRYLQFVFHEQMSALYEKARGAGIELIGDLPIYPAYDGADVWAGRDLFQLDAEGAMESTAAVPPDYFSATGQLWGNPLYRWGERGSPEENRAVFDWWRRRFERILRYQDRIKFDHFRGVVAYGAVEASAPDASEAVWNPGPGKELFEALSSSFDFSKCLVAEDLGIITDEVVEVRTSFKLPGMKILIFGDIGDPTHDYWPHNAGEEPDSFFYTGTHDNETLIQKVETVMDEEDREFFRNYCASSPETQLHWQAIELLLGSEANTVVFPMQDVLGLGPEARMNNPSEACGWWRWRMTEDRMTAFRESSAKRLADLARKTGRFSALS